MEQGYIEEVSQKPTSTGGMNYRLKINGKWISAGFKNPNVQVGDQVQYSTVQKGQYTNIGSVTVIGSAPAGSAPVSAPTGSREMSIIRQNSLGHAVQVWKDLRERDQVPTLTTNPVTAAEEVMLIASIFEKYSSGNDAVTEALNQKLQTLLGSSADEE